MSSLLVAFLFYGNRKGSRRSACPRWKANTSAWAWRCARWSISAECSLRSTRSLTCLSEVESALSRLSLRTTNPHWLLPRRILHKWRRDPRVLRQNITGSVRNCQNQLSSWNMCRPTPMLRTSSRRHFHSTRLRVTERRCVGGKLSVSQWGRVPQYLQLSSPPSHSST